MLDGESITIYSDSQSALKALTATTVNSRTVLECLQTIRTVSSHHEIRMEWVKAHAGNKGNEIADGLAKLGARTPRPVPGPGPFHTVPPSFVRNQVYQYSLRLWTNDWWNRQKCRQSKIFFKKPYKRRGKDVSNLDRKDAGIYIRWTTGHAFLGYHNSLIAPEIHDPRCRLCFNALETASHLLLECPALEDFRRTLLLSSSTPPAADLSVSDILTLARPLSEVLEVADEQDFTS
jgi:ribonuclease HI